VADVPPVEFFFSPGSRYSYLASTRIAALEAKTRSTVEWRAVNGPDIRALRGRDPFAGVPVSGQYDWGYRELDARRWAAHYGIAFREPPTHAFDFALLARAAVAATRLDAAAAYGRRICAMVYASDVWPIDARVCIDVAVDVGLSAREFATMLDAPETAHLLANTAVEAVGRGVFGVPTFFVGDQMFWGNDRIVLVEDAIERRTRGA
jgi:2-hydroxychromene-2-carboxylate isomerase